MEILFIIPLIIGLWQLTKMIRHDAKLTPEQRAKMPMIADDKNWYNGKPK